MASDKLADFIPEGGDSSAYTAEGFQDFVPDPNADKPVPTPPVTVTPQDVAKVEAEVEVVQEEVQQLQDEVTPPVVEPTPEPVVEEAPVEDLQPQEVQPEVVPPVDVPVEQTEPAVTISTGAEDEGLNPSITPVEVDPELDAINDAEHPSQAPEPQAPVLETKPVEVDPELARLQAENAEPTMDEVIANAETPLEPLPDLEPLPEDN